MPRPSALMPEQGCPTKEDMMPDYTLPFPGRELADQELTYDVCYAKILPQDRASIVERAWRKGEQAARDIFVKYGGIFG